MKINFDSFTVKKGSIYNHFFFDYLLEITLIILLFGIMVNLFSNIFFTAIEHSQQLFIPDSQDLPYLIAISLLIVWIDRLFVQKKALRKRVDSKKELIASTVHDLQTPITVIKGYGETMAMKWDEVPSDELKRYLDIILKDTEQLSCLVSNLFEGSKIESLQTSIKKKPFDIKKFLKRIEEKYQNLATQKEVLININELNEQQIVFGDRFMIERVVQNIMDNALRYTAKGGMITLSAIKIDKIIQIEIKDTGLGIPKNQLNSIFDCYHKDNTSQGAGLGLSIVKKILALHDSSIRVESEINKGTSFIFELPIYY